MPSASSPAPATTHPSRSFSPRASIAVAPRLLLRTATWLAAALFLTLPLPAAQQPGMWHRAQIDSGGASQSGERPPFPVFELAPPDHHAPRPYIVEFQTPPLAGRRVAATTADLDHYRTTSERFRTDLARLDHRKRSSTAVVRHEYFRLFHGASVTLDRDQHEAVRQLDYVKAVHEDEIVSTFSADTTRLARIGAERFWSQWNSRGEGIVVAVIDTGIDYTHPALGGGFGPHAKVMGGWDFVDDDGDPMDRNGHGTHVAGIIAGDGDGVTGVAPAARLLAYRVLDDDGRGFSSAILAALERIIDPNQDGDLSDRADVANLSLGGPGDADSPTSTAVDRAVEAGVVVVLAAGNWGTGQSIGSPAAARRGITVGNSDAADRVVTSSSRGPAFPDLALKPEIVAPGTAIESAWAGGGTRTVSGTSMAAPHVAGAAALLLSVRHGSTPEEIRAALVGNAEPLAGDEVMAQGGGRLRIDATASSTLLASPAVLSFGNGPRGGWSATRTVELTNRGTTARQVVASFSGDPGVSVIVEPGAFTIAAGETRRLTLTASVASEASGSETTFALGGHLLFAAEDDLVRLPLVLIDAAFVTVAYDAPEHDSLVEWRCAPSAAMMAKRSGQTWSALLPYRRCYLTVAAYREGATTILFESHSIEATGVIHRSPQDSPHRIEPAGADPDGSSGPAIRAFDLPYFVTYVLSSHGQPRAVFTTWSPEPVRINDLPSEMTLSTSEALFDFPNRRILAVTHEPLRGLQSSVRLTTSPGDLRHARVSVVPQPDDLTLLASYASVIDGYGMIFSRDTRLSLENGWQGDLYVAGDPKTTIWGAPLLSAGQLMLPDPTIAFQTPAFRPTATGIVVSNQTIPSPAAWSISNGGSVTVGNSPLHLASFVDVRDTAFAIFPSVTGPVGEAHYREGSRIEYELRDGSGSILDSGTAERMITADPGKWGTFNARLRMAGNELDLTFDTSRSDWNPPALTSLRVVGADGSLQQRVGEGWPASLHLSVGDYAADEEHRGRYTGEIVSTRVEWRSRGGAWEELPLDFVFEDHNEAGRSGSGLHYSAELRHIATRAGGPIDLRIEMSDLSGNRTVVTLQEAFTASTRNRPATRRSGQADTNVAPLAAGPQ
jgi:hypothetical protein